MKKPRVLLADDHQVVLEGLKSLLKDEVEIVGSVQDGRALVNQAAAAARMEKRSTIRDSWKTSPNVSVLKMRLEKMRGYYDRVKMISGCSQGD